jgi:transposase-like protein
MSPCESQVKNSRDLGKTQLRVLRDTKGRMQTEID